MVDLLLEKLKLDLSEIRRPGATKDEADFQKKLIVLIGAYTREVSKLVVRLY